MEQPRSTVVVVTWRGRDHLGACLDALAAQDTTAHLLVVDNASTDGSAELLATHPSAPRVLRCARNLGYAGAMSAALPGVETPFVAWCNDDAVPDVDWLSQLESALQADERLGAVSGTMLALDGTVQSIGVEIDDHGYGSDAHTEPVFGFCGGSALLRVSALRAIGGVAAHFFCYYEDTDISWRLRLAGCDIGTAPAARAWHQHGASATIGSPRFHRWNERNRLLMLLRCAPARLACVELLRFGALTALLALRRIRHRAAPPEAGNFGIGLRIRVLAELLCLLPTTALARRRIGRAAVLPRRRVFADRAERP